MKHLKKGRKFSRKTDPRKALLKSLVRNLVLKGKIKTTEAKAKELRSFIERFIEKGKKGDLSSVKYLEKFLQKEIIKKIIVEISPKYKERKGGYTRIIKMGPRKSDGAKIVIIELV